MFNQLLSDCVEPRKRGEENMGAEMGDARGMIGRLGEEYALGYFKKEGYEVVCRNWRCKAGEIDLILKDRGSSFLWR